MQYADVVFLQGDDADTAFAAAGYDGNDTSTIDPGELLRYLSQWDCGDYGYFVDDPGYGTYDDTLETDDYIMSYNWSLTYCGLVAKISGAE